MIIIIIIIINNFRLVNIILKIIIGFKFTSINKYIYIYIYIYINRQAIANKKQGQCNVLVIYNHLLFHGYN